MTNKLLITISSFLLSSVFITACSQNSDGTMAEQAAPSGQVAGTSKVTGVGHSHPANKCTNSIQHTHPNGGGVHKHRYVCKPQMSSADAHKHPANKCTKSVSHAHPNGKGTHKHRYVCKATKKMSNAHVHAANAKTRSSRHVHPNGSKTHSHSYGK